MIFCKVKGGRQKFLEFEAWGHGPPSRVMKGLHAEVSTHVRVAEDVICFQLQGKFVAGQSL